MYRALWCADAARCFSKTIGMPFSTDPESGFGPSNRFGKPLHLNKVKVASPIPTGLGLFNNRPDHRTSGDDCDRAKQTLVGSEHLARAFSQFLFFDRAVELARPKDTRKPEIGHQEADMALLWGIGRRPIDVVRADVVD